MYVCLYVCICMHACMHACMHVMYVYKKYTGNVEGEQVPKSLLRCVF
jgi:hypothetical protein